jgi:hypothetical protein
LRLSIPSASSEQSNDTIVNLTSIAQSDEEHQPETAKILYEPHADLRCFKERINVLFDESSEIRKGLVSSGQSRVRSPEVVTRDEMMEAYEKI